MESSQNSLRSVPGRQVAVEKPDQCEGDEDPAVSPILAHSRARLPPANSATADSAKTAIVSATSAGCEKRAANPPQPSTARPR